MRILIVDLTANTPAYTAYFCDALNKNMMEAEIAGIEKKSYEKDLKHLITNYKNWFDLSEKLNVNILKEVIKLIEYIVNWIMVIVKSKKYDIIHIQWFQLLNYTSIDRFFVYILQFFNKNLIYTVHNVYPHDSNSTKVIKRYKKVYKQVKGLVVHSEKTSDELVKFLGKKLKNVVQMPHGPMFHDIPVKKEVKKENNLFGILGKIRPYKGVEDAILAISSLKKQGFDFKLLIAGQVEESYKKVIIDLISEHKLENEVSTEFGFIDNDDYIKKLKSLKGALFPYKDIDQSGAAITALSVGTPVVGYNVGGLTELIENNYNGILVKKNDIEDLGRAILEASGFNNEEMDNNCRSSLENISWGKASKIMEEFYSKQIRN